MCTQFKKTMFEMAKLSYKYRCEDFGSFPRNNWPSVLFGGCLC